MANEGYSQAELRQLAAAVVERILGDESLSDRLAERLGAALAADCPKGTLCCSKDHNCKRNFFCSAPFTCSNGFTSLQRERAD